MQYMFNLKKSKISMYKNRHVKRSHLIHLPDLDLFPAVSLHLLHLLLLLVGLLPVAQLLLPATADNTCSKLVFFQINKNLKVSHPWWRGLVV
jgi:membrane-associated PAP2 superfamily phosphatase